MTTDRQEPPAAGRSEAAVKLAELLAQVGAGPGSASPAASSVPGEAHDDNGAGDPPPVGPTPEEPFGAAPPPAGQPAAVAPTEPGRGGRHRHARHRERWERVRSGAFAVALVLLVGAIPVLGLVGQRIINQTRDGRVFNPVRNPNAPGYEALVDPTPTALMVQVDSAGKPTSATLLALSAGDRGGSVIFLPLDTAVTRPALGVDRLSVAYALGGVDILKAQVAGLLNIGIDEAVKVDDAKWSQLVRPVGPLTIDNPDSVTTPSGRSFASGRLTLTPDEIGPFMAARAEGESDLNRLARQKLVWLAWLKAVGAAPGAPSVSGDASSGTGRFVRTLARGTVQADTLAVTETGNGNGGGGSPAFQIEPQAELSQVTKAVPFPRSPTPGGRITVRLLNGTKPGPIPSSITDALVRGGAELTSLGNPQSFGRAKTRIDYYSPVSKARAESLHFALGFGEVVYVPRDDQSVDVTVTLGADMSALGSSAPVTTAGAGG